MLQLISMTITSMYFIDDSDTAYASMQWASRFFQMSNDTSEHLHVALTDPDGKRRTRSEGAAHARAQNEKDRRSPTPGIPR